MTNSAIQPAAVDRIQQSLHLFPQTSSKLGQNPPAAERHLTLARLFKAGSTNTYSFSVAERRLIPMIGINRRCGDSNNYVTALPALKSRAKLTWSLRDREEGFGDPAPRRRNI